MVSTENLEKKEVLVMALQKHNEEQTEKMSMIELANIILTDQKKEMNFIDLFNKVAAAKGFAESQKNNLLARFYTDLNVDGRFTTLGSNVWGLKRWYPVDQTSEKSLAETRKRDLEAEEEMKDELPDDEEEEESSEKEYQEYNDLQYNDDDE